MLQHVNLKSQYQQKYFVELLPSLRIDQEFIMDTGPFRNDRTIPYAVDVFMVLPVFVKNADRLDAGFLKRVQMQETKKPGNGLRQYRLQ